MFEERSDEFALPARNALRSNADEETRKGDFLFWLAIGEWARFWAPPVWRRKWVVINWAQFRAHYKTPLVCRPYFWFCGDQVGPRSAFPQESGIRGPIKLGVEPNIGGKLMVLI